MTKSGHSAWDASLRIIRTLRGAGHLALLAGGCVRDQLLGRTPKDFDVVTNATPRRVAELFPRARLVGAKFGVVIVRSLGHDVEVATFRRDGTYRDGRHPDDVAFGTEEEDAQRRDFTINGLFLDPQSKNIIDHVGGCEDLKNQTLRTIGEADRRFAEDHLRMLRAVRFAARLGFHIEPSTWEAICRQAVHLQEISAERVWMELALILADPSRAFAWGLMVKSGLRRYLSLHWPVGTKDEELIQRRVAALPAEPIKPELGLASLLADESPGLVETIGRELRLSNQSNDGVVWLVQSLPIVQRVADLELADFKGLMSGPCWEDLLALLRADLVARERTLEAFETASKRAKAIPRERIAPPPLVTGDDLVAMGVSPGPNMGEILRRLYREQLNEKFTDRGAALIRAREEIPA